MPGKGLSCRRKAQDLARAAQRGDRVGLSPSFRLDLPWLKLPWRRRRPAHVQAKVKQIVRVVATQPGIHYTQPSSFQRTERSAPITVFKTAEYRGGPKRAAG